MSRNYSSKNDGLGVCSILTIIFVVLKLIGAIDWSWIWVLSPLWISLVAEVLIIGIIIFVGKKNIRKSKRSERVKW